jgi:hypothetical protein
MSTSAIVDRRLAAASRRRIHIGAAYVFVLTLLCGAAPSARCPAAAITMAQDQPTTPAAPAPAPTEDQPKVSPSPPENVEMLSSNDAAALLGKKVKGPKGEDLGLVVDVLVDTDGRPRAAVIDFGGFLGVGSRKIAIDWKALDFTPLGRAGSVELGLDRAQIEAAQEYKPGQPTIVVVTAPHAPSAPADVHR